MIVVLVEAEADGATVVSRETLTFARGVAERLGGAPIHAVVVGAPVDPLLAQLGEQGVHTLHVAQDDRLAAFAAAAYAAAVVDVVKSTAPTLLMAAGTPRGNEILAHVATRLGVAMAANAVAVDEVEPLTVTRQVVGGAALEEMLFGDEMAVVSVAGHACDVVPAAEPTELQVSTYAPSVTGEDLRARVARTEEATVDDSAALTEARVVVGAGRGAGGPDGFKDLLDLTELLGGTLGVSRVVTSLGWRPHHEQIGQTGSRISPDLYIPCGISGAIQHWAGCQSAKTILAINSDPDAPMVTKAHYAVIGDLHEILPAINEELRNRLGQPR